MLDKYRHTACINHTCDTVGTPFDDQACQGAWPSITTFLLRSRIGAPFFAQKNGIRSRARKAYAAGECCAGTRIGRRDGYMGYAEPSKIRRTVHQIEQQD